MEKTSFINSLLTITLKKQKKGEKYSPGVAKRVTLDEESNNEEADSISNKPADNRHMPNSTSASCIDPIGNGKKPNSMAPTSTKSNNNNTNRPTPATTQTTAATSAAQVKIQNALEKNMQRLNLHRPGSAHSSSSHGGGSHAKNGASNNLTKEEIELFTNTHDDCSNSNYSNNTNSTNINRNNSRTQQGANIEYLIS